MLDEILTEPLRRIQLEQAERRKRSEAGHGELPSQQLPRKVKTADTAATQERLPFWPDDVRCLPNEILRCALFNAKNRKQKREELKNAAIFIIGDGAVSYTGQELRQDDQTVWMQLIDLAKSQEAGVYVEFTPKAFCQAISWPLSGQSYTRLRECLTRMQATALSVYSARLGEGISLSMIPVFKWEDQSTGKKLPKWQVKIAPELKKAFGDVHFTRVEWQQRLALPDGLATWLHGYFATHSKPFPIKLETIKQGAGITIENNSELRRMVADALRKLVEVNFLADWNISGDSVSVKRKGAHSR